MDNKLSELSKPVDFLKAATLIAARNFERWSKLAALTSESSSVLHSSTLLETSQLLSALLAELEASRKSNAFLKEQLAKLANFNPDWDMLEACRNSWREVAAALKEAEAKLEAKDGQLDAEIRTWTQQHVNAMARIAELEAKLKEYEHG